MGEKCAELIKQIQRYRKTYSDVRDVEKEEVYEIDDIEEVGIIFNRKVFITDSLFELV